MSLFSMHKDDISLRILRSGRGVRQSPRCDRRAHRKGAGAKQPEKIPSTTAGLLHTIKTLQVLYLPSARSHEHCQAAGNAANPDYTDLQPARQRRRNVRAQHGQMSESVPFKKTSQPRYLAELVYLLSLRPGWPSGFWGWDSFLLAAA